MSDVLQFHVRPELTDPALVLAFKGWNDAGESASAAVRYLSEAVSSVSLAEIDPEEFFDFTVERPTVEFLKGETRRVLWPSTKFRFGTLDDSRQVVTAVGTEPHLRWRQYCDTIVELVQVLGIKRVVMLGSYLADVVYSLPVGIQGFASDATLLERVAISRTGYEGPTGIIAVLADRLEREGLEVLSLWAGLPHYLNASPNPRGSLALLHTLCRHLDCKIDDGKLQEQSLAFEERIAELVDGDPELREYVKQLKRRDFVQ